MVAGRDLWLEDAIKGQPTTCEPVWVDAEHPLFLLYTSGSTGKPKGVQHSTGGYLLMAVVTMKWTFDNKPSDIFWCTADIGWVTGHTYVATARSPAARRDRFRRRADLPGWRDASGSVIQNQKVTVFYTAPTAIRSLIKAADTTAAVHPKNYDLSSLRLLGTVGEPINPEAWMWYYENVGGGRCPIVDTWWQTETGAHMITPLAGRDTARAGLVHAPIPGIQAAIVDETGHDVRNGQGGILVVKRPGHP